MFKYAKLAVILVLFRIPCEGANAAEKSVDYFAVFCGNPGPLAYVRYDGQKLDPATSVKMRWNREFSSIADVRSGLTPILQNLTKVDKNVTNVSAECAGEVLNYLEKLDCPDHECKSTYVESSSNREERTLMNVQCFCWTPTMKTAWYILVVFSVISILWVAFSSGYTFYRMWKQLFCQPLIEMCEKEKAKSGKQGKKPLLLA